MNRQERIKNIDNYSFIEHIVSIKCVQCGDFFEPDKTKPIKPVCGNCKSKLSEKIDDKIHVKIDTVGLSKSEKKRLYQREYMKTYWRKRLSKTKEQP